MFLLILTVFFETFKKNHQLFISLLKKIKHENIVISNKNKKYFAPKNVNELKKTLKQYLAQCPIILPPTSVADGDIIRVGRNTNDIKIIPKKKKILNNTFLII